MSYSARILNVAGDSPEKTRKSTLLAYLDGHRDARHAAAEIAAEADATIADLVAALKVAREELHYHRDSGDDISGSAMATIDAALAKVKEQA